MAAIPAIKPRSQMKQHGQEVYALKFHDGVLFSGGADKLARSWDVRKGKNLKTFKGHTDTIWCLEVSDDGHLYTGSADKSVIKWNASKGKPLMKYPGHKKAVFCLGLSASGDIFSGSDDKTVMKHAEHTIAYKGHKKTVLCMAVDGNVIFSGSSDGTIRAWNATTDQCTGLFRGHTDIVYCLSVVDGVLYSGSRDGTARAWDIITGECIQVFSGHTSRITCLLVRDNMLYTGSADSTVRVWHCDTGDCLNVLQAHQGIVLCLSMNPGGTLLFSGGSDFQTAIWNTRSQSLMAMGEGHQHWVLALAAGDDNTFFSSSRDGSVAIWDVTEYAEVAAATPPSVAADSSKCRITIFLESGDSFSLRIAVTDSVGQLLEKALLRCQMRAGSFILAHGGGRSAIDINTPVSEIEDAWTGASSSRLLLVPAQAGAGASASTSPASSAAATPRSASATPTPTPAATTPAATTTAATGTTAAAASASSGSVGGGGSGISKAEQARMEQAFAAERAQLSGERDAAQQRVAQLERKLKNATEASSALEEQLAAVKAAASKSTAEGQRALQQQIDSLQSRLQEQRSASEAEAERLSAGMAAEKARADSAEQQLATTQSELQAQKQATAAFERERAQHAQIQQRMVAAEERVQFLESEVERLHEGYAKERKLRIRYFNKIEDMKGKIRVYCRARPFTRADGDEGHEDILTVPDEATLLVRDDKKGENREFSFAHVFPMNTTQDEVYAETTQLIQSAIDGFNVCIFAYGQTGSGKTFTMSGEPGYPGITPRAFEQIFSTFEEEANKIEYSLSCYMLELYNDELVDLLYDPATGDRPKLDIHKDERDTVYISNITVADAHSVEELHNIMTEGLEHRHTGTTNMNEHSSRSHLILSVLIQGRNLETGAITKGKLSLVDLAGSERFAKTGANKERMREAQSINRSLSALGNVIAALTDGETTHIPYRSNKLTYLMSDSIGGNAKTLMFVNISPSSYNLSETVNSLGYAARVKEITNNPAKQQESREIQRLKSIIKKLKSRG